MAFTVEDGTGLTDSNSYVSVADATAYHADRGNTAWDSVAEPEIALVRATQAIDQYGFERYLGYKSAETQALEWPRTDAVDRNGYTFTGVPIPVVYAVCEAALIEAATPGAMSPALERGGAVRMERVEGAVTVEYDTSAPSTTTYTSVNRALSPVLSTGSNMRVVRV
jgi:hypothetical protein